MENSNTIISSNDDKNDKHNNQVYQYSSPSSSSTEEDDTDYKIKTKICTRISKELGLEEFVFDEISVYNPPKEHGLSNADIIIPSYYHLHKDPSKILGLDFFKIIQDDIRNFRPLNSYQFEYIKELKDEYKYELIELFNEAVKAINSLIDK